MDHSPERGELASTSASSGDVNTVVLHKTTGGCIPNVPIELTPTIGMEFATLEEAYNFYNTYAWHCGFSVRKDTIRILKTSQISRRVLSCSKAGLRDETTRSEDNRKRRLSIMTRCACPAKLYLNLKDSTRNVYHVTQFVETHNHILCTPTKTRRLRSHKKFTEDDLNLITRLKASGIGVARSIDFMRSDVGGPSHLGFSERDARNAIRRQRQAMHGNDASTLLRFFQTKSEVDSLFSYQIQVDDVMRLTSCFWVDRKSKEDYMAFGDVVCFDTTYKTNEYDVPFGPFVGVNHHMQTCLLGAGLLFGETVEDFKWLFETWVHAMGGVHPKTIITDQDAAIAAAVKEVFPNTNHMLCLWHIQKKVPEKFSHLLHDRPTFKSSWNHCVYGTNSAADFDSSWHAMIEEFNLHEHAWMRHMFEIRRQWIPAYTKGIFSAGMRTTSRSESINAFFDGFVNHRSSLMNFANGYDKAVERRREAEEHADFQNSNGKPVLKTRYGIEAQMAELYTLSVFSVFQKELEESLYYIAERVGDAVSIMQRWEVFQFDDPIRSKRTCISWNPNEWVASCECMKFESSGIVCRHVITLFRFVPVVSMPSSHLLARWTKTAKSQFKQIYTSSDNIVTWSRAVREHAFARLVYYIRHEAVSDPEAFDVVKEDLEKLIVVLQALREKGCTESTRREVIEIEEQPNVPEGDNFIIIGDELDNVAVDRLRGMSGILATQSSQACPLLDPYVVKTKGRTAKRMKGPLEKPRKVAKLCRGCNQLVVGHDKRNCPILRFPAISDGSNRTCDVSTARARVPEEERGGGTN